MALVSYDSSDCSNSDDENLGSLQGKCKEFQSSVTVFRGENHEESSKSQMDNMDIKETCLNLFQSLPKPSHKEIEEEDDEFLNNHEAVKKGKAKISIPCLSDFKDVEDGSVAKKPYHASGKKCGLLSILPEPKFSGISLKKISKPLIPNVVERKISQPNSSVPIKKNPVAIAKASASKMIERTGLLTANYSDSDEGDQEDADTGVDFFSINSQSQQVMHEKIELDFLNRKGSSNEISSTTYKEHLSNVLPILYEESLAQSSNPPQNSGLDNYPHTHDSKQTSKVELDDEAMRQLCGSRKRHKKEDIEVITVDQQQVLSDSREWLVKGLMDDTSKRVSASKRRGNEPTNQQKRKHQITYLAHQAKANEAELQNQWANNRMSKRQTQSKYGF